MLDDARRLKLEVPQPEFDDLFFVLDDVGHAHHCGIVTSENPLKIWPYVPLTGIAGNTSVDGTSSDGIGVFEHTIGGRLAFVRLPEP
jgi:hypothetical protein